MPKWAILEMGLLFNGDLMELNVETVEIRSSISIWKIHMQIIWVIVFKKVKIDEDKLERDFYY